jgi:hypothetical protein
VPWKPLVAITAAREGSVETMRYLCEQTLHPFTAIADVLEIAIDRGRLAIIKVLQDTRKVSYTEEHITEFFWKNASAETLRYLISVSPVITASTVSLMKQMNNAELIALAENRMAATSTASI